MCVYAKAAGTEWEDRGGRGSARCFGWSRCVWDVCLFGYLYGLLEKIGLGK